MKKLLQTILFTISFNCSSACINTNEIKFEKINDSTLLMIKNNTNYGLLEFLSIEGGSEYRGYMPQNQLNFRFFNPTLCEKPSPNSDFMIGDYLLRVRAFKIFK
jgi:hypothetical protein